MRNPIISPRFEESSYKGQDVVHRGVRIPLKGYMPLDLLVKFDVSARQRIKLPAQDESGIKYRAMTDHDLPVLRKMWFDPEDPTFPTSMEGHIGIVADHGDVPRNTIGGVIWTPQGKNLFMHQLIASDVGKAMWVPTLLIWQSVVKFCNTEWHSLDIGVSYNPKRYAFFKKFAVEMYPIILKKPLTVPVIRLSPFRGFPDLQEGLPGTEAGGKEANMTALPRGVYALEAALRHAGVGRGDEVLIVKTFGSSYISSCVTKTIEKLGASWRLRGGYGANTKAVIAIHEFGIPIFQEQDLVLVRQAQSMNTPVIEDCAWMSDKVWDWTKYAVFSPQKMLGVNYGGFLMGVHIPDEQLWQWGLLDTVKRGAIILENEDVGAQKRIDNWWTYHMLVVGDGMTPDDCYDYANAMHDGRWVPTVYLQKFASDEEADAIVRRLEDFGIEAGRYWGEPIVFLPIHQNMSTREVEYMFAVVRGYFNACRDFR